MRRANKAKRRSIWRRRPRRCVPAVSGELRVRETLQRWELDLIVGPLFERLRAAGDGVGDGDR